MPTAPGRLWATSLSLLKHSTPDCGAVRPLQTSSPKLPVPFIRRPAGATCLPGQSPLEPLLLLGCGVRAGFSLEFNSNSLEPLGKLPTVGLSFPIWKGGVFDNDSGHRVAWQEA